MDTTPKLGSIGRLGRYAASHRGRVFLAWALVAIGLGLFAPRVETALSGAGWEAGGSESVRVRDRLQRDFGGAGSYALQVAVHAPGSRGEATRLQPTVDAVERVLAGDPAVGTVIQPQRGVSISTDGRTAIVVGTAARGPNEMVAAADRLRPGIAAAAVPGTEASLTGASAMWADFNEANREAMLKSELISWPVTLAILVLAFGSLVAAGLPLMLTITGLVAAAGVLYLGSLLSPISIWAMNFALMFALALGIDYALFVVMRFRGALAQEGTAVEAAAAAMDSAGKAVLFSAFTVLVSISAVLLVPSTAFRSVALGIMVSVLFVLAATLTLLPAVLAKLGSRINRVSLPWAGNGDRGSPRLARWAELLWRRPLLFGGVALVLLVGLALPTLSLKTGMPSIKVVPKDDPSRVGYRHLSTAFGTGKPATVQVVAPGFVRADIRERLEDDPGIASVAPPVSGARDSVLFSAVPANAATDADFAATLERLRDMLPSTALVGGAAAENHDLESALSAKAPLAIGLVVGLGFLLLLIAFRAPLVAGIAVLANLLSTAAAFGVAKLIFQDGHLGGLLGFESQGFLDAWGPIFFFAMIFAIAMDYTVFLLSSAREEWERTGDAKVAMVGGLARSGRVILAAGPVMVAVFFTFAFSGPLPPKEMGVILGVAVLLDTFPVRLLLLPVFLRLAGRAAWSMPAWPRRSLPDVPSADATRDGGCSEPGSVDRGHRCAGSAAVRGAGRDGERLHPERAMLP